MINNVTAALDVSDNMFNEGVNVLNDVVSTHVNWITLLKGDNYKHCGTVTSKQNLLALTINIFLVGGAEILLNAE